MMGFGTLQLHVKFEVASFSRCRNIRGSPEFWGAPLAQNHDHFFLGGIFMIGCGKPQQLAKFEVAIFSRCRDIKGGPQILRELP